MLSVAVVGFPVEVTSDGRADGRRLFCIPRPRRGLAGVHQFRPLARLSTTPEDVAR